MRCAKNAAYTLTVSTIDRLHRHIYAYASIVYSGNNVGMDVSHGYRRFVVPGTQSFQPGAFLQRAKPLIWDGRITIIQSRKATGYRPNCVSIITEIYCFDQALAE